MILICCWSCLRRCRWVPPATHPSPFQLCEVAQETLKYMKKKRSLPHSWICFRWFFTLWPGKSPSNHHVFGDICVFFQAVVAMQIQVVVLYKFHQQTSGGRILPIGEFAQISNIQKKLPGFGWFLVCFYFLDWFLCLPKKTFVFFPGKLDVFSHPGAWGRCRFSFLQNWSWKTPLPVVDWEQKNKNITHRIKVY